MERQLECEEVSIVATDGGGKEVALVRGLGWGVFYRFDDPPKAAGAVCGPDRTAPCAEAVAVAQAICQATGKVAIVTGSSDVRRKVQRISEGSKPWGKRQEAWMQIWPHGCEIHIVHWAKAHLGARIAW